MCGIVGQFELTGDRVEHERFERMCESLAHRGPDDRGIGFFEDDRYALGHLRLSFLDLTEFGRQPMYDAANDLWIVFNGEIYNHAELRAELSRSYHFRTRTDTEVILAGFSLYGPGFVSRLNGMFAFAVYSISTHKLWLVRDRFGIKPLYYHHSKDRVLFASEIRPILGSGKVNRDVDHSGFADFFVYRYVPSPKSIWRGVSKLEPAHYLEFDLRTGKVVQTEYWQLPKQERKRSRGELVAMVGEILQNSVQGQLKCDVEIGALLSGGYDSSALALYAVEQNPDLRTFSVGFTDWQNSEDQYARTVAEHLGVSNRSVILDGSSLKLMDIMPKVYDEPIADISIIPTYAVSKLARSEVKAVISGEGADEIFCGYNWQKEYFRSTSARGFFGKLVDALSPPDAVGFYAQSMAMGWFGLEELKKLMNPDLHTHLPEDVHWFYRKHYGEFKGLKSIQYMDLKCFMAELVLTKVDRASMANSLEVRVPFLDHRLVELIFSSTESDYFDPRVNKLLLWSNIRHRLPNEILSRPKQGFVGPDSYYQDSNWYATEISRSKLYHSGIISKQYVGSLLSSRDSWRLWKLLVMSKWFEEYC